MRLSHLLAAVLAAAACAPAGQPPVVQAPVVVPAQPGSPVVAAPVDAGSHILYRVTGPAGGTVHLLGSVHLLSPDAATLPAVVDSVFARARLVVFETALDTIQMRAPEMLARGRLPAGTTLRSMLTPETVRALDAALPAYGVSLDQMAAFKPWVLSLFMTQIAAQRANFQPQFGVDMQLHTRARDVGKPTRGLESADFQLGLFDRLAPADVEFMLVGDGAASLDSAVASLVAMKDAWKAGNARALDSLLNLRVAARPSLFATLVVDRNRAWLPQIEQHLLAPGEVLVVVGAGHLVGPQGLVAMLRARGYTVQQR